MNKKTGLVLVVLGILLFDQFSKFYVKLNFQYAEAFEIFSWWKFLFVENNGMAFSIELLPGALGKYLLTSFRIVIVSFLGHYIYTKKIHTLRFVHLLPLLFIFAGAIGNIIDCLFYGVIFSKSTYTSVATMAADYNFSAFMQGRVVDMLYFPLFEFVWPSWVPSVGGEVFQFFRPIFNVADSFITVGIAWIVILYKRVYAKEFRKK